MLETTCSSTLPIFFFFFFLARILLPITPMRTIASTAAAVARNRCFSLQMPHWIRGLLWVNKPACFHIDQYLKNVAYEEMKLYRYINGKPLNKNQRKCITSTGLSPGNAVWVQSISKEKLIVNEKRNTTLSSWHLQYKNHLICKGQ